MLETGNVIISGNDSDNQVSSKHINLGEALDAFVSISTNDEKLKDIISKTIYDLLISKIQGVDTYKEFSEALDVVNSNIQSYTEGGYDVSGMNIIIGIQENNILYFSKMGKACALLIKQNSEVIEITDLKEAPSNFVYISNGNLKSGEIILFATTRILNHLTNTEILESASLDTIEEQNKNIREIIEEENTNKDIGISSFRYSFSLEAEAPTSLAKVQEFGSVALEKVGDTLIAKRIIAIFYKIKDALNIKGTIPKNVLLFFGVFVCFIFLYSVSSSIFTKTDTIVVDDYKVDLQEARRYIEHGAESINNPDVFAADLEKAETLIDGIKDKQLFLGDIEKLLADISALRKQFNQVDTYNFNDDKLILSSTNDVVKIIGLDGKVYYIEGNKVVGPIVNGIEPKISSFEFSEEDSFVDAVGFKNRIILLTQKNRVVSFVSGGNFSYVTVNGQETWESAQKIDIYGSNIYLLDTQKPQIYKHRELTNNFDSGQSYFKDEDVTAFGEVLTMAIDGGFYMMKKDGSMIKFFNSPTYRIESLFLNNLPKNYTYDEKSSVFLTTRSDLAYLYLFMNNKIWIFEPNTRSYTSTKSLQYIGQIEGGNAEITGVYPKSDGSLYVSSTKGIYQLDFQVSGDKKLMVQ